MVYRSVRGLVMNEDILQLINNEQERESCYIRAQNIIENAGLKNIEVDRTQFTARNDNNKLKNCR